MTWLFGDLLKSFLRKVGGGRLVLFIVVAALFVALCAAAYLHGRQEADQAALVKQLTNQVAGLQGELESERVKLNQMETLKRENSALSQRLAEQSSQTRIVYRSIRERAPAVLQTVSAPVAHDDPRACVFPPEFVRLWNDALTPSLRDSTAGVAETPDETDSVEVGPQELLANHIDNAEISQSNFDQCAALIEFHQRNDDREWTR